MVEKDYILGTVVNIKVVRNTNIYSCSELTIEVNSTGKKKIILYPFSYQIFKGDSIYGSISIEGNTIIFDSEPVIEPVTSYDGCMYMFNLAFKGLKITSKQKNNLYFFFKKEAINYLNKCNDVDDVVYKNRDNNNIMIIEMINIYCERFEITKELTSLTVSNITEIESIYINKFFKWWKQNYLYRRLILMGLNKTIIRKCIERNYQASSLYYTCLNNPYIVESIPLDICNKIMSKYKLKIDKKIIDLAFLIRCIDKEDTDNGWPCHPLFLTIKKYPSLMKENSDDIKILNNIFDCHIRYNCLYLKYQNKIENICFNNLNNIYETYIIPRDEILNKCNNEQAEALKKSLNYNISIITGGPGTGKTTLIRHIIEELNSRDIKYTVLAPTGKAVSRLKDVLCDSTNIYTIDSFLRKNLNEVEMYIIDETSMVSNSLMAQLFCKLENIKNKKFIFVGDPNQLNPIEPGNFFIEIIASKVIPTSYLTQDCRREKKGNLYKFLKAIETNNYDDIDITDDIEIIEDENNLKNILLDIINIYLKNGKTLSDASKDIVIISPYNKNLEKQNLLCREIFVPKENKSITDSFGNVWKIGDRVMMTVNNYDINVMNGEEGEIINFEDSNLVCKFKNNNVNFPIYSPIIIKDNLDDDNPIEPLCSKLLVLSWAITVHKSQGSEWPYTIFYIPDINHNYRFFNKNLIFTAISRSKKSLKCISKNLNHMFIGLNNDAPLRHDNLSKRLMKLAYSSYYVQPHKQYIKMTSF